MVQLIDALLCDENGIGETAYVRLIAWLTAVGDFDYLVGDIIRNVEATDGRFYFPDDFSLETFLCQPEREKFTDFDHYDNSWGGPNDVDRSF